MKHPYLVYLLAVVAPSAAVVVGGVTAASSAWTEVRRDAEARVARMALHALQQDLGAAVEDLRGAALPTPVSDSADALVSRALRGDTVNGLVTGTGGVEIRVALPAEPGDPEGTVRQASAPLPPSAVAVGRTAGFGAALYLGGQRQAATEPAPGPERLDAATLEALAASPGGTPLDPALGDGTLAALEQPGGGAPGFGVLAVAPATGVTSLPVPLILVMALLLVFACLAGWIQLAGESARPTLGSLALLSLVPALTAWGFLVHGGRLFDETLEDADRRNLTRALAVARARNVADDPAAFHQLSELHAFRIREGKVEAASLEGDAGAVAALPAPPASFTSTGRVGTPEGPSTYVALRLPRGGHVVATAATDPELRGTYARRAVPLGWALAGWLLLLGGISVRVRRPVSS